MERRRGEGREGLGVLVIVAGEHDGEMRWRGCRGRRGWNGKRGWRGDSGEDGDGG